MDFLGKFYI
ncbi:hypothetical protein NP493_6581g00000 [Ridgeia piscesae]|uniref:Uncharacterized protein n=1 Tax=Ridgeia piscesae TaxID=27915 RepID=A0AAD9IRI7_RIDPI|nr:hypothetical protein NP493_6581g00000 [Ridgeia piscesae]